MQTVRALRVFAITVSLCCALTATVAQAATVASVKPSFSPDRVGATSAFTLALSFSGEQQRVPAPVKTSVVHLPRGLGISLRGVGVCPLAQLRHHGPSACPASSLVGSGHSLMEAELGALVITENATLRAFRGPDRGGRSVLEISGQGLTPLVERVTFAGVLAPDSAPYGTKLEMSIPPIPTLPTEPDASTVKFSLTLGGSSSAGHHPDLVRVPSTCPAGGFPFAADFAFSDGSNTSASAQAPCS
jgi:hypothetical protein